MTILHSVEGILTIIIMISLGAYLTAQGWFKEDAARLFSQLVTVVALPPYMIWNLMSNFDRAKLLDLGKGLVVPLASMLICYFIGWAAGRFIQVPVGRQGTFRSMFFSSNSVFIGLPVSLALFGQAGIPYALLYFLANAFMFWTLGVHGITSDGTAGKHVIFSLETFRQIFSPPLKGFILAVLLILLGVELPDFVMKTCYYLGNLTTPLSMLFIGIAIYGVEWQAIRLSKDMIVLALGRFLVAPLTVLLVAHFIPIPLLMQKVFIVQAAMPVMTQTSILSKAYGADMEYAAVMTSVTTILAIAVIPFYMWLFEYLA